MNYKEQILYILVILFMVIALLLTIGRAKAFAPEVEQKVWDKPAVQELIHEYAVQYKVSEKVMNTVVNCESGYDINNIGDKGKALGLSQINMDYWGDKITPDMARNPDFALEFLAEKLSNHEGHLWTCYRLAYK